MIIEAVILDHLRTVLGVPAYAEQPTAGSGEYLVLQRLGGAQRNRIPWISAAIQSCAPSLYEAAALSDRVRAAMERLADKDGICESRLVSESEFSDPEAKIRRYQAIFEITYYREES